MKDKLIDLTEHTFSREKALYLACKDQRALFTSDVYKKYNLWSCEALVYLLDNISIRSGTKLYRQIIGIPMGTNCAPLVADLFLFCYERDFMKFPSPANQADIIEAFNSTSRYLDDLLNIDNIYFEKMVNRIKIKLILLILKRRFWVWIYPFLMAQLPLKFMINGTIWNWILLVSRVLMEMSPQLIRFARASSNVSDFIF